MLHPIHRVSIPYSKFSSPKTCRKIDKSSFKMGHTRLIWFFSLSNLPLMSEGHWYASKFYDITNMQTKKTHAHCVSFSEILWKFVYVAVNIWSQLIFNFMTKFYINPCLHRWFLSRLSCNFKISCKPGAIFSTTCCRNIAGVLNVFETWCSLSTTKIASSCRNKNRLCKQALSIVWNRFHKTAKFQEILLRLTQEKEANKWKIAKNG